MAEETQRRHFGTGKGGLDLGVCAATAKILLISSLPTPGQATLHFLPVLTYMIGPLLIDPQLLIGPQLWPMVLSYFKRRVRAVPWWQQKLSRSVTRHEKEKNIV